MKESDILYETTDGRLWICRNARGDFEVIENGMPCARRRMLIGQSYGLEHAKAAADKLLAEILAREASQAFPPAPGASAGSR